MKSTRPRKQVRWYVFISPYNTDNDIFYYHLVVSFVFNESKESLISAKVTRGFKGLIIIPQDKSLYLILNKLRAWFLNLFLSTAFPNFLFKINPINGLFCFLYLKKNIMFWFIGMRRVYNMFKHIKINIQLFIFLN